MKFKVIDSERLSIYLTNEELRLQRIDAELLKEPERLKKLIRQAGEETGFHISDSALEVEIIPILDGDLLVSIKKIENDKCFSTHFCFEDTESLILACGQIEPLFFGASNLYFYGGLYHLVLKSPKIIMQVENLLREFGEKEENISEAVLIEHGKLICEQKCVEMFTKAFFNR